MPFRAQAGAHAESREHLVFGPTLEGLFIRGLGPKVDESLKSRLAALGLDLRKPLLPAYPRAVVNACINETASTLYPTLSAPDAWYQVGKHVTVGIGNTLMGSAVLSLVRLVGPKKSVQRMPRTFSGTNNYMQVTLRELGPSRYELDLTPSNEQPSYMQAVIEDILNHAGARDLRVTIVAHDLHTQKATYGITWAA